MDVVRTVRIVLDKLDKADFLRYLMVFRKTVWQNGVIDNEESEFPLFNASTGL